MTAIRNAADFDLWLGARKKRVEAYAWGGSALLHALLLLLRSQVMPVEVPLPRLVEISIASEIDTEGQDGGDIQAAPGDERKAGPTDRAPGKKKSVAQKLGDKWAGFKSAGPWGGGKPGGSGGSGSSNNLMASAKGGGNFSDIPKTWAPASSGKPKAAGIGGDDGPAPATEDGITGLSASPWGGSGKGSGTGGLAGSEDAGYDEGGGPGSLGGGFQGGADFGNDGGAGGRDLRSSGGTGDLYDLRGPLAKRKVLKSVIPQYPEWALAQGIETNVTVYFSVFPDGRVKEPVIIKKTSGYPQLDTLIIRTLAKWKFSPLPPGRKEEQWGLLTFHFRLRG